MYAALSRNELVFRLNEELETPRALDELPPALERHVGRPVTEAEILAWLTLGAAARHEGRPLLRPVVHGFVRGIGGAVVSFPEGAVGPRLWLAAEDEAGPAEPLDREREGESSTSAAAPSMSGPVRESGSPPDRGRDKGPAAGMGRYPQCSPLPGSRRETIYRDGELPGLPGGRSTIVPAPAKSAIFRRIWPTTGFGGHRWPATPIALTPPDPRRPPPPPPAEMSLECLLPTDTMR